MRLFVALDLPEQVRAALAEWGAQAVDRAGDVLRAVPPENLHLTLAFLGAREETQAEAIGAIVTTSAGNTCNLSLGAPLWLPPRRPGVLTVEVSDATGALAGLHATALTLYRSIMSPKDARYEPLDAGRSWDLTRSPCALARRTARPEPRVSLRRSGTRRGSHGTPRGIRSFRPTPPSPWTADRLRKAARSHVRD